MSVNTNPDSLVFSETTKMMLHNHMTVTSAFFEYVFPSKIIIVGKHMS